MKIIDKIGNKALLSREKTLFLCSKQTPIGLYDNVFRWTDSLSEKDCVCCFNSTEMESEVLKALLVARVPTILFVMNRFTDVNNMQIEQARQEDRMLIVVLKRDEPKGKGATPRLRNEYVLSICQHVVCGYINKNGSVFPLLAGRADVVFLTEDSYLMAAEQVEHRERWKVAEDKVLLRMYYADMGIHAIHKKLSRTYLSIYNRIRAITQSEEVLKGREFEDYVLGMFDIQNDGPLVLQEWQGDKSTGTVRPENNSNPDLVFRYNNKEFAIECKWRDNLGKDLGNDMFSPKKLKNYKAFSESREMPVTIVLGVSGEPCNPDCFMLYHWRRLTLLCLKLNLLQSSFIPSKALMPPCSFGER
ncbi:MAG: hypothetical protein J6W03_07775 [Bacteroidaceae bacterium]|nr:hypothetical protein [Bacteroidaceae bacterium]